MTRIDSDTPSFSREPEARAGRGAVLLGQGRMPMTRCAAAGVALLMPGEVVRESDAAALRTALGSQLAYVTGLATPDRREPASDAAAAVEQGAADGLAISAPMVRVMKE